MTVELSMFALAKQCAGTREYLKEVDESTNSLGRRCMRLEHEVMLLKQAMAEQQDQLHKILNVVLPGLAGNTTGPEVPDDVGPEAKKEISSAQQARRGNGPTRTTKPSAHRVAIEES
ncbi:hypothetical protein [Torentivirus aristcris]|uniref:Uncharacterized protein n=1 Tax=Crucivirus-295 TaxID=2761264 RepID=A0A7G5M392_9VIRU|nr:hypothetical protein [Crucivirus-295]